MSATPRRYPETRRWETKTQSKWNGGTLEGYPLVQVNEGGDVLAAATQTGQRTVMVRVLGPKQSVALVIGGERVATMRERNNGEAADRVAEALARMAEECGAP